MSKRLCTSGESAYAIVRGPLHKWWNHSRKSPSNFITVVMPLLQMPQHHHLCGEGARPNVQAPSHKCKRHSGKRPGRFAQVTKPPGHLPPQLNTSDIVRKAKVQATSPQCKSRSRKCGSDFTQLWAHFRQQNVICITLCSIYHLKIAKKWYFDIISLPKETDWKSEEG